MTTRGVVEPVSDDLLAELAAILAALPCRPTTPRTRLHQTVKLIQELIRRDDIPLEVVRDLFLAELRQFRAWQREGRH